MNIVLICTIIFLYYFLSRAIIFFYEGMNTEESTQADGLLWMFSPILGEIFFLFIIADVFMYQPMMFFFRLGRKFKDIKKRKNVLKINRENYLKKLSDFGLTPQDIPNYIKNNKELDDYLSVWRKHTR